MYEYSWVRDWLRLWNAGILLVIYIRTSHSLRSFYNKSSEHLKKNSLWYHLQKRLLGNPTILVRHLTPLLDDVPTHRLFIFWWLPSGLQSVWTIFFPDSILSLNREILIPVIIWLLLFKLRHPLILGWLRCLQTLCTCTVNINNEHI